MSSPPHSPLQSENAANSSSRVNNQQPSPASVAASPPRSMSFFVPFGAPNTGGQNLGAGAEPSGVLSGSNQDRPGIMWTVEVREESGTSSTELSPSIENGDSPTPATGAPPLNNTDETNSSQQPPLTPHHPPFVLLAPNGNIIHQFTSPLPPRAVPPPRPTSDHQNLQLPAARPPSDNPQRPTTQPIPPPWVTLGAPPPMFSFFMPFPIPMEPQPDPAKAAELLRSLPAVSKGLLKRIERIAAAEEAGGGDEEEGRHGWKCGICLDGVEDSERKETGVKALPCNHLFHGSCLEPWLTTKRTCPACRLDLDPLQTLHIPSEVRQTQPGPIPTSPTRSSGPHPYFRGPDSSSGQSEAVPSPATATATPNPAQSPFTFIWRMPLPNQPEPSEHATRSAAPSPQPEPTTNGMEQPPITSSHIPVGTPPRTPNLGFNVPLHASPLPMMPSSPTPSPFRGPDQPARRSASPVPRPSENQDGQAPATTSSTGERPQPERRPHITFMNAPPGGPSHLHQHQHHHHHHHVVHHHIPHPPMQHSPIPQIPIPIPQMASGSAPPNFQFLFNVPRPGEAGQALPPMTPTPPLPTASKPFVPQSLESWTEQREKALGWRCDGTECLIAPSTDSDGDIDMLDDEVSPEDKEILNIYSPVQPPLGEYEQEAMGKEQFVILSCAHRWHRTCLRTAARSSGRGDLRAESDGRVWVRCQRCRKDGWVENAEDTPSEAEKAEVEMIIAA